MDVSTMHSHNFQPLQSRWPQLYEYAKLAESYVHTDPHTAVIKLRCFAESLVGYLYRELRLPREPSCTFFEMLSSQEFQNVVASPVIQKLHAIRMVGNKAAHAETVKAKDAITLLKDAYLIGQWLSKTHGGESGRDYPPFIEPKSLVDVLDDLNSTKENLAAQLEDAKRELARLESVEKASQAKIAALNESLNEALNEANLQAFKDSASKAAATIDFEMENTRRLVSIYDAFAEYSLNEGQAKLVNELDAFLSTNEHSVFLLKGYAGTGKTFITKGLTEYFRSIGRNYILAAPTGKAAKVIAHKTRSPAYTVHKTIYSFKDIAEYRDHDVEGTETFKFYASLAVNSLSADTVYIVDEASMIADIYQEAEFFRFGSGFLLRDFLKFVNLDHNDHRKKVIFIGDNAQLPPVGMAFSPALDAAYLYREHQVRSTEFELTEVVRQKAESGVIANSIQLRRALQAGEFNQLDVDLGYPDVLKVEYGNLISRYLESCGGKINGESIVIAHSNSDVRDFNQRIREHFFPGVPEVTSGDKVLAVANSDVYPVFISNGDFGLIRKVSAMVERRTITLKRRNPDSGEVEDIPVSLAFRDVIIGFKDLDGTSKFFEAKILEDLLYSAEPSLSSDQSKAMYLDFCMRHNGLPRKSIEFKQSLRSDPYFNALRLKFGYAITCHKAQGSEWNHVFVKCKTYMTQLSADYFRWLYTAITRAATHLYLLDPPHIRPWSKIEVVAGPGIGIGFQNDQVGTRPQVERPAPAANPPAIQDMAEMSDTFGIPASAPFLLNVLQAVRDSIAGKEISIAGIDHNQYQEAYVFRRGDDYSRIDIRYNQKGKISGVSARDLSGLGAEVLEAIAPLQAMVFSAAASSRPQQYSFDEPFLNDFHQRLTEIAGEWGVDIQQVLPQQWFQRYTFARGGEVAVCDVFYNSKHQFTKCAPVLTACSPGSLAGEVVRLLTKEMNA